MMTSKEYDTTLAGFYDFVEKYSVVNPSTPVSDSVILGPYARSTAYKVRRSAPTITKVFKLHDVVDKYYVIDMSLHNGPLIYQRLVTIRSFLKRLEKEMFKK